MTDLFIGDNGETVQLANDGRINVSQITSAATVAVIRHNSHNEELCRRCCGWQRNQAGRWQQHHLSPSSGTGQVTVSSTGGGDGDIINTTVLLLGAFWGDPRR